MRLVANICYTRYGWGFSERCKRALEITLCIKTDILYDFAYEEQLGPKASAGVRFWRKKTLTYVARLEGGS